MAAIALVALAVVVLTVDAGRLPVVALALTVTWGLYAYLKKSLPIGPNQGFFLEVLILSPFALAYIGWQTYQGTGHFLTGNTFDTAMLLGAGVVTAVPLMLYANGAKLLAALDHRHHAIYRADNDLSDSGFRVLRTLWPRADDRLSDDLGGAGTLYRSHAAPGQGQSRQGRLICPPPTAPATPVVLGPDVGNPRTTRTAR